jgi:hypothetical protein
VCNEGQPPAPFAPHDEKREREGRPDDARFGDGDKFPTAQKRPAIDVLVGERNMAELGRGQASGAEKNFGDIARLPRGTMMRYSGGYKRAL